jgi:hypothetical protein
MATICGKNGCKSRATRTVRFTDLVHTDLDTDFPIVLCDERANEMLGKYEKSNVAGVKEWLNSPL